jgi:hypothetical protein
MKKIVTVTITLVACLAILEIGLRVMGRHASNQFEGFFAQGGLSYRLASNVTKRINWPSSSWTVHTDNMGFRTKMPGLRRLGDRPYYALVGSSEVFGNGLDYEKTFAGVLAEKMEQQGIDVLNMAIGGQGFDEQSYLFKEYARSAPHKPTMVLVWFNPLFISEYDEHHANAVVRHGYLLPEDWKVPFAKIVLQNKSSAYCFLRDATRKIQKKFFDRKDFSVSVYFDLYSKTSAIRDAGRKDDFLRGLDDLGLYIQSLNATPVYLYTPTVGGFMLHKMKEQGRLSEIGFDTDFFAELIRNHCKEKTIRFINLEPLLEDMYRQGVKLHFDLDSHFNASTSQIIGEYVYNKLQSRE